MTRSLYCLAGMTLVSMFEFPSRSVTVLTDAISCTGLKLSGCTFQVLICMSRFNLKLVAATFKFTTCLRVHITFKFKFWVRITSHGSGVSFTELPALGAS